MKTVPSLFTLNSFLNHKEETFHVARTTISSERDLVLHYHDYAEIFWIREGKGIHLINGQETFLEPGSLVMIRPCDTHTFKVKKGEKDLVITNIAFQKVSLDHFQQRYFKNYQGFFWTQNSLPYSTMISREKLSELSALTDRLLSQPRCYLHLDHIMLHIFNLLESIKPTSSQLPHWLIFAIENYRTPLLFGKGTPGFVHLCNRSIDHINRTLQKHLKQTLSQTINKIRLDYAAQQLTMTNCPIKTICFECGFKNISYFYRVFKKIYGITPAEYREKNHKIF